MAGNNPKEDLEIELLLERWGGRTGKTDIKIVGGIKKGRGYEKEVDILIPLIPSCP